MRRRYCLLLISIMCVLFTGCGKIIGNNSLGTREGVDCEIMLSVKNGEIIEKFTLTDSSEKNDVIAYCNSMEQEVENKGELSLPEEAVEYVINVSYADGTEKSVTWKEGYLFTEEGKIYEANQDFTALLSIYHWEQVTE